MDPETLSGVQSDEDENFYTRTAHMGEEAFFRAGAALPSKKEKLETKYSKPEFFEESERAIEGQHQVVRKKTTPIAANNQ
jgi:hypothetical protein